MPRSTDADLSNRERAAISHGRKRDPLLDQPWGVANVPVVHQTLLFVHIHSPLNGIAMLGRAELHVKSDGQVLIPGRRKANY